MTENRSLPHFSNLDVAQVIPNLKALLTANKTRIESLLADPPAKWTWNTLMLVLDQCQNKLGKYWSPISHLQAVSNDKRLREAYTQGLDLLSTYHNDLAHNTDLFHAIEQLSATPRDFDQAQQTILKHSLRDFKLAGVHLDAQQKKHFKTLDQKLSQLQNQFDNNNQDATDAWTLQIEDKTQLAGLSNHGLAMLAEAAKAQNKSGWLLTLQFPCYYTVMTYANNRNLRRTLYEAYSTRASDQGPQAKQFDNSEVMNEILATRHELAQCVGFNNYAEYSLASKMAPNPKQVMQFLNDLVTRCKPQAKREMAHLQQIASAAGIETLEPWDLGYFSEKARFALFDINEHKLRAYFPMEKVIAGLFDITQKLYRIHIKPLESFDAWHKDVHCHVLSDQNGTLRGYCYFDLFARNGKRGGAWMDEYCSLFLETPQHLQKPIAYVNCNFAKGKPSLLTHEEVLTLFHEFGHALHHLLTQVHYLEAAGINGVPWDAVEFPSQFFEHWCWQFEALQLMSEHHEEHSPLPKSLFEKMLAAKNFQSAMQLIRQLEFSLFDFELHLNYEPGKGDFIQSILDNIRSRVSVSPISPFNRFQHSFSHIFAGGYAAGYYSYLWADVLASDAFACFEKNGLFDQSTGQKFLQCILEQGGSQDPLDLFKAFAGHEPSIDALLKHRGIE